MTTSDNDAAATAKRRFDDAIDALQGASSEGDGDSRHSASYLADDISLEFDEAKEHAVSAIDTTLQSVSAAATRARTTYRRNPKSTLVITGAVAVGLLVVVTLLRRR